jgi:predicted SAM-dependent methyltransferase
VKDEDFNERYRGLRGKLVRAKEYAFREANIRWYLRTHEIKKLQLGAGTNVLDGWLNTDREPFSKKVAYLDVSKTFPFAAGTFDYVLTEHQIEHVDYEQGCFMLRECARVMKKGSRIRVSTPDLARLLALYRPRESLNAIERRYLEWIGEKFLPGKPADAVFVINNCMRFSGHQFLYDGDTLARTMRDAGFDDVKRVAPNESEDPVLRGVDAHGRFIEDEEINSFESMVFEGVRC